MITIKMPDRIGTNFEEHDSDGKIVYDPVQYLGRQIVEQLNEEPHGFGDGWTFYEKRVADFFNISMLEVVTLEADSDDCLTNDERLMIFEEWLEPYIKSGLIHLEGARLS